MNHLEASIKLENAKKELREVGEYIKTTDKAEDQINAVVMIATIQYPDGKAHHVGTIMGDGESVLNSIVEAMENDDATAKLITDAVSYFMHRQTCDCENCVDRRKSTALNKMLNKSKN